MKSILIFLSFLSITTTVFSSNTRRPHSYLKRVLNCDSNGFNCALTLDSENKSSPQPTLQHNHTLHSQAQRFDRDFSSDTIQFIPILTNRSLYRRNSIHVHNKNHHNSALHNKLPTHISYKAIASALVNLKPLIEQKSLLSTDSSSKTEIDRPFTVNFKCDFPDKSICDKAHKSYDIVFDLLSDLLVLKRSIVVDASYSYFCQGDSPAPSCDTANLGLASSASHWLLTEPGLNPTTAYPQALAKQLSTVEYNWAPADIIAKFNGDKLPNGASRFWFEGDGKMKQDQYDFTYVVMHEVLHGLGILSYFGTYVPDEQVVIPLSTMNENKFATELPFLFDSMVYEKNGKRNLRDYYNEFKRNSVDGLESYRKSEAYENAKTLYRLSTESGLEIRLPRMSQRVMHRFTNASIEYSERDDESVIVLHTCEFPFKPATSISHLDQATYDNTEEFLMRPTATRGKTLKSLTKKDGFPVGKKTIRLLSAMGYEITSQPLKKYGNNSRGKVVAGLFIVALMCIYLL